MSETQKDHPDVITFPPLILAGAVTLSWVIGWLVPISLLPPALSGWSLWAGSLAFVLSGAVALSGIAAFRRAGTHIEPHKPALVLVADGPYRFTRNPMYVGLLLLHLAISLLASLDWGLAVLPCFWLVLHHGVVLREESYLTRKFGAPYTAYLGQTRRWF